MYIGIDVGGTYTDAVIVKDDRVWRKIKKPTRDDITSGVLEAFEAVLENVDVTAIKRVVLSTTLVTNHIAQGHGEKVGLVAIPGPGVPTDLGHYPQAVLVQGAIDFRGRETVSLNENELSEAFSDMADDGIRKVAVVGKFSNRNNIHEKKVLKKAMAYWVEDEIFLGHKVAGKLNFPRRMATTYLTALTHDKTVEFTQRIRKALDRLGITAPAFVLKADAGAISLDKLGERPVETVFSGPAASTLGALALLPEGETSVVVDIGGTTTDLALILNGKPLMASKGAVIGDFATHVHALAVQSLALGGDSTVTVADGEISITPYRSGQAYGLGGPEPTPTDALRILELTDIGDKEKAFAGIGKISNALGLSEEETARRIVSLVEDKIMACVEKMFFTWEQEPAYRVWEVLQEKKARPNNIVGIGGAAAAIVPALAGRMNARGVVPEHSEVANALGAALADPTISISLFADSSNGLYFVEETGFQGSLPAGMTREEDIIALAKNILFEEAAKYGIEKPTAKVVHSELFNMIRGYSTTGRRFEVVVQTPWSIRPLVGEGGATYE